MDLRLVRHIIFWFICLVLLFKPSLTAAQDEEFVKEISELSLEELMNLDVITVQKRTEKVHNTPSAIYIITDDDVRRSGATTIVEALRGAPGIQVSRIDSNLWAVSSRGFNERYSNKLLVMIDGRTVYTPIYSGVYWDVQDTVIEDIDRIEVVRGPGSTIWGANAVNGVINIITKDASRTQGWLLSQIVGNEERTISTVRYGGHRNNSFYWKVYAKYTDRDAFVDLQDRKNHDDWYTARIGFRMDWLSEPHRTFTIQGDVYTGRVHSREYIPVLTSPYVIDTKIDEDVAGGNILAKYRYSFSDTSDMVVQFYYDRVERHQNFDVPGYYEDYVIDTVDLDMTHTFSFNNHNITWGGGIRYIADNINTSTHISFQPSKLDQYILNAFIQDEIGVIKDTLYLIVGSKIEHNEYTGFEYEPNARLLWRPSPESTLWAAVSRSVRTPSRIEMDGRIDQEVIPGTPPVMVSLVSKDGYKSEELIAYELGYRTNIIENLYIDVSTFYNVYDKLRSFERGTPFYEPTPLPHYVIPYYGENKLYGRSYGAEAVVKYRPMAQWDLTFTYSYLQMILHKEKGSTDIISESAEDESPHNQFSLMSFFNITPKWELDVIVHYIDDLPAYGVDENFMTNIRIGWQPDKDIEVSLALQNALDDKHTEIASRYVSTATIQIERSIYAKVLWKF